MTQEHVTAELTRPFQIGEVKFKPQSVKGSRALAMAYIDCRVVQDRLDEVLGVENWMDEYEIVPDGSVVCRLRLKIGGEWVTKTDVGSPSEQPDGGDRLKAAFSDALKRAAVKFGIGRYLYRLPAVWCDYDPQRKQFTATPQLPAWAVPRGGATRSTSEPHHNAPADPPKQPAKPAAKPAPPSKTVGELWQRMSGRSVPKNGAELVAWLASVDQALTGLLKSEYTPGGLADAVVRFVAKKEVADLAECKPADLERGWNHAKVYVKNLETAPVKGGAK